MTDPLAAARCWDCRFGAGDADGRFICRRRSPVPRYQVTWYDRNGPRDEDKHLEAAFAIWPQVALDDWCGEFQLIAEALRREE